MKFQIRHLNWILTGPSFAVWVYAWNIQIAQLLPANIVIVFYSYTYPGVDQNLSFIQG